MHTQGIVTGTVIIKAALRNHIRGSVETKQMLLTSKSKNGKFGEWSWNDL